jgi:hypothetical protein
VMGILEDALSRLFGAPTIRRQGRLEQHEWRDGPGSPQSVLYKAADPNDGRELPAALAPVYGECLGGSLLDGSLKVALLYGTTFDLYNLAELAKQPEVRRALAINPQIMFFMDAANVWFYGVTNGDLYVYDAETDELDRLGPIGTECERLLKEWQGA